MFRLHLPSTARRRPRPAAGRRGAILIVVLALLTIFALIGITFVFYSDGEKLIARIYREAQGRGGTAPPPPDANTACNTFLGGFIFDVQDTGTDLASPLRGHSLARTMFGGIPGPGTPFHGVGTFHEATPYGYDRALWVNHSVVVPTGPGTYQMLDPERTGFRTEAQITAAPTNPFIPKNAPYTYPDLKDFYLAAISPATGEVMLPSYYRPWMFNQTNPNVGYRLAPWNPNDTNPATGTNLNTDWVNPEGRAKILRPRPVDQLNATDFAAAGVPYPLPANFTAAAPLAQQQALYNLIDQRIQTGDILGYPAPNADGTYTGDFQSLTGGVGTQKNDTLLLDLGLPPMVWPPGSGKLIKPLVGVLVTDLDGLLNYNAQGNARQAGGHTSHAGYGPWEVNLSRTELLGAEANALVAAKYGAAGVPVGRNGLTTLAYDRSNARLPQYALVNWDGTNTPGTPPLRLPAFTGSTPDPFPFRIKPEFLNGDPDPTLPFWSDNTLVAKRQNHPGLYNPGDWGPPPSSALPSPTAPFSFPLSDLRRLRLKYADELPAYQEMMLNKLAVPPTTNLIGTFPADANYKLDPAHAKRMLFTPLSANLDRPGISGNYNALAPGAALQLPAAPGAVHPFNPALTGPFPPPGSAGPGGDFAAADLRHQRAGLGPVDLNRSLADYRNLTMAPNVDGPGDPDPATMGTPTPQPLSPGNMGNAQQAWLDRQTLARDIFARLVIATGAVAYVDPATGFVYVPQTTGTPGQYVLDVPSAVPPINVTVGDPEMNALRYLAQLAANGVDYRDIDDVNTPFVWNPKDPNDPLNLVMDPAKDNFANSADIQARVVFGTEKPRLVINEAFAQITNDPAEAGANANATMPAHVRFWVELLNPTSAPYPGGATDGALGIGAAQLYYDATASPVAYNPYKVVIARVRGTVATNLRDPSNVTGDVSTAANPAVPDVVFNFDSPDVTGNPAKQVVVPNDGIYSNPGAVTPGFAVCGPGGLAHTPFASEFFPDLAAAPWNGMIQSGPIAAAPSTGMGYIYDNLPMATQLEDATNQLPELKQHVVLLRRLANPYLPPNDPTVTAPPYDPTRPPNPYITVDYMDHVPAADGVRRGMGDAADRTPKMAAGGAGYDPLTAGGTPDLRPAAVGKVQPYAGFASAAAIGTVNGFPLSCVIRQEPLSVTANHAKHTFFRHNGHNDGSAAEPAPTGPTYTPTPPALAAPETLMAPFDWLVHPDRPVANPLELLHVQAVKPHELTQFFLQPPAGGPLRRGFGRAPWFGVDPTTGHPVFDPATGQPVLADIANGRTNNALFRALELIRVKPWGYGVAHGGRIHGQVNINTMQDQRVLRAVADPQAGNFFTQTEVDALWTGLVTGPGGRTALAVPKTQADGTTTWSVPAPGKTVDDADPAEPGYATNLPNYDRPFKPYGVGEFAPGGPTAVAGGSGIQDTVLRTGPNGIPRVWFSNAGITGTTDGDEYLRAEMARKMFNNTTTVSNTFAVWITVGFYEVRTTGGTAQTVTEGPYSRYLLGKEAYQEVPGELRQQFFAVVDRTNLVMPPPPPAGTGVGLVARPLFAALEQTAYAGGTKLYLSNAAFSAAPTAQLILYADGQPVTITAGAQLVLGVGANQEIVTVSSIDPADAGVVLGAALVKSHAAGELVSNGVPGNPGPVGSPTHPGPFDPKQSPYQAVVPYIAQTR